MTNEELTQRATESHDDWWARADALGVIPDADSWTALNPGAGWAGNEDRAAAHGEAHEENRAFDDDTRDGAPTAGFSAYLDAWAQVNPPGDNDPYPGRGQVTDTDADVA